MSGTSGTWSTARNEIRNDGRPPLPGLHGHIIGTGQFAQGLERRAASLYPEDIMSLDISALLTLINEGIALQKKIAAAIESEKDLKRRKRLLKALEAGDLEAIREILYEI